MIKKYLIGLIVSCGTLLAQPQLHTLTITPGPTLTGPGAIFYLEDTTSPGANSVSWKAPVSLDNSVDYIWPIAGGFNDQPFCTDSTDQTSWCTNITLPNLGEYRIQDSLGAVIPLLKLSSNNWAEIGTISAMEGSGDVLFFRQGSIVAKFSTDLALREAFIPPIDQTGRLGSENSLWLRLHVESGDFGRSITPRVNGSIFIHSAIEGVSSLSLRNRDIDLNTVPELELILADFIPNVDSIRSLGHNNRRWNGFFNDIDISGICTGCLNLGLTEGSVPFVDSFGNLIEDNAKFFWENTNKQLLIGSNTPLEVSSILELIGDSTNKPFLILRDTVTANTQLKLYHSTSGTTAATDGAQFALVGNDVFFTNREPGDMRFFTDNAEKLLLDSGDAHQIFGNLEHTGNISVATDSIYGLFSAAVRPTVIYSDIISGRTIEIGPVSGGGAKQFEFANPLTNVLDLHDSVGADIIRWDATSMIVSRSIMPGDNSTYAFGQPGLRWSTSYIDTGKFYTRIEPDISGGADLGTVSLPFGTQWINTLNVNTAIATDASGGATIGTLGTPFGTTSVTALNIGDDLTTTGILAFFGSTSTASATISWAEISVASQADLEFFFASGSGLLPNLNGVSNIGIASKRWDGFFDVIDVNSCVGCPGGGHTLQDNGTPLTDRANINFRNSFTLTDDSGNDATIIDLTVNSTLISGASFLEINLANQNTWSVDQTFTAGIAIGSGNDVSTLSNGTGSLGSSGLRWDAWLDDVTIDVLDIDQLISISEGATREVDLNADSCTSGDNIAIYAGSINKRVSIGCLGASDTEAEIELTADSGDIVKLTTITAPGLYINTNRVVGAREGAIADSSCTPDATWDANEQNCLTAFVLTINAILDSMRATGGHGLIAD